jgi:hypothetical protein
MLAVVDFATRYAAQLAEWGDVFREIPADNKRRGDALGAALRIKQATKALDALIAMTAGGDGSTEKDEAGAAAAPEAAVASAADARVRAKALHGCHAILKEATMALLELTFPLEEDVAKRFDDDATFFGCTRRLDAAVGWAMQLSALFASSDVAPNLDDGDDSDTSDIPAALLKQLVESARAQAAQAEAARAADEARSSSGRKAALQKQRAAAKAVKVAREAQWAAKEGRMALFVGKRVWEALCMRRGTFRYLYCSRRLHQARLRHGGDAEELRRLPEPPIDDALGAKGHDNTLPGQDDFPLALAVAPPAALLLQTWEQLHLMLRAKGPVPSDDDEASAWAPVRARGRAWCAAPPRPALPPPAALTPAPLFPRRSAS